jgi:hypothetical protein
MCFACSGAEVRVSLVPGGLTITDLQRGDYPVKVSGAIITAGITYPLQDADVVELGGGTTYTVRFKGD